MANRQIEHNYETVEEWVGKYNLLVGDIGDIDVLSFTATDMIDALNINDQRIDDLVTYVGPDSNFNVLNADGLATGDVVTKAIETVWVDYKNLVGRGTNFTTTATTVIGAINELDAEIGDLNGVHGAIDDTSLVGVVNNIHARNLTAEANLAALDTRVGNLNNFTGMHGDGISGTYVTGTIKGLYDDYKALLGRGTALSTSASAVIPAVNELDANIGNLTAVSSQIRGASVAATFNIANTKINTLDSTLTSSINDVDTKVGDLSSLDAGFTGANDDSIVAALNYVYNIQTGETVSFTNASVTDTLDVGGISTFSDNVVAESNLNVQGSFTSRGIDDNATAERLEITNSLITFKTAVACTDNVTADNFVLTGSVGSFHNNAGQKVEFDGNSVTIVADAATIADFADNTGIQFYRGIEIQAGLNAQNLTVNSNDVWHEGNDGAGSGLDADKLDGLHASSFAKLSGNQTFANNITIAGDLTVQGEISATSSNELNIGDSFINLNQDQTGTPTANAGIRFGRGSSPDAEFYWQESTDRLIFNNGSFVGEVITTIGGVDADTLGGEGSSYYLAWSNLTGKPATFAPSAHTHAASDITSGSFAVARIPALPASQITTGKLAGNRIPSLPASKITTGTFNAARIPSLAASIITSGSFSTARIPALPTSKITSGTFADARIPSLNASKITAGEFAIARLPSITFEKILASDIRLSTEAWSNTDAELVTPKAVENRILSKGYTTNSGDITNVTASTGLTGGGASGSVSLAIDNAYLVSQIESNAWHSGNDGAGSGLDADLLDGQQGSYYLPASSYTAADVLAKIKTVDGPGSGLNADVLDGISAGSFLRVDANDNVDGHTEWQDNFEVRFGNGADMRIRHTGTTNQIDVHTGQLLIRDGSGNGRATFDIATGQFTAIGDITAFSDERLKENFAPIDGLNTLEKLNPFFYDWNDKAKDVGITETRRQVGVRAQEVEEHFPEALGADLEEFKTVSYDKLVPLLIAAVKELSEKVKALENA